VLSHRVPPALGELSSLDANSPIVTVGALVGAEGIVGIAEAWATLRPSIPRTRNSESTTASRLNPIVQVPTGWKLSGRAG